MSRNRPTKEELRHDSFVEFTAKLSGYVQGHFMTVLVGLAVVAVLIVGSIYIQQSRQRSQLQAAQLLHRATGLYTSGAYSEGLLTLDDILSRYGGTDEGKAALYFAGASHLALGENDAALERFQSYLELQSDGLYAPSARIGLALAREGRGELAEAAQAYRTLRDTLGEEDPLYVQACFGEARVLREQGQIDAAIAALEPLKHHSDFAARQEAEAQISVLRSLQSATTL